MANTTNNGDLNLNSTAPWENGSTRLNAKNLNALTQLIFDNSKAILNMPAQYAAADDSLKETLRTELTGQSSDAASVNTFWGVKNFATTKDTVVSDELKGNTSDDHNSPTIWGAKRYADKKARELLGTSYDDDNQPTIVGTRKYVDNTKNALQQTLEGQEIDERTTLTLNGIRNRIIDVENALTNKATGDFSISGFSVSGDISAGKIDVGTVNTTDVVTSSIKGSEKQSSITFSGESIMFNGNLMFSGQEMTANYNDGEKSVNLSLSKLDDSQKTIKTDLFAHKIVTPYIELTSDQEPTGNMAVTANQLGMVSSSVGDLWNAVNNLESGLVNYATTQDMFNLQNYFNSPIRRTAPVPIDSSAVFDSFTSATEYIARTDSEASAYIGQIISVKNTADEGNVSVYVIGADKQLHRITGNSSFDPSDIPTDVVVEGGLKVISENVTLTAGTSVLTLPEQSMIDLSAGNLFIYQFGVLITDYTSYVLEGNTIEFLDHVATQDEEFTIVQLCGAGRAGEVVSNNAFFKVTAFNYKEGDTDIGSNSIPYVTDDPERLLVYHAYSLLLPATAETGSGNVVKNWNYNNGRIFFSDKYVIQPDDQFTVIEIKGGSSNSETNEKIETTFIATQGITTYAEIEEAVEAGKACFCLLTDDRYKGRVLPLTCDGGTWYTFSTITTDGSPGSVGMAYELSVWRTTTNWIAVQTKQLAYQE